MRPVPLITLAFLFASPTDGAWAWEVSNRVVIEHGEVVIDHSKTIAEITRAQAQGGFAAEYGLGLFQNRFKTELTVEAPAAGARANRLALTTRITTAPVIYVASEFPADSCAYAVVLGHERQHQLFDREVLREMPAEIRAMTRAVFNPDALAYAAGKALERARGVYLQQVKYLYDSLSLSRHQAIDNPESYRRLGGLCNGEIAKRLSGAPPR